MARQRLNGLSGDSAEEFHPVLVLRIILRDNSAPI
jgi:CRISPR/Cas system-associated endonuclease Cas1